MTTIALATPTASAALAALAALAMVATLAGTSIIGVIAAPTAASVNRTSVRVWAGADGYTPWANTPASMSSERLAAAGDLTGHAGIPCHADAMGGCVIPACGDPLAGGSCEMPPVRITVDPAPSPTGQANRGYARHSVSTVHHSGERLEDLGAPLSVRRP